MRVWTLSRGSPLSSRTFRWLWLALATSVTGLWMQLLAAQWTVLGTSEGAALVPLVQSAASLPLALLAIPAGVMADSTDRRRLLLAVQVSAMLLGAAFTVLSWRGALGSAALLALTAGLACTSALTLTPLQSLVPDLVPRSSVVAGAALLSAALNTARVVGPLLAGVTVSIAGTTATFACTTAASTAFVVVLLRWNGDRRAPVPPEPFLRAVRSGARYVRHSPQALRLMARASWLCVCMMGLFALLPLVATAKLGLGPIGLGALIALGGAGAVGGDLLTAHLRRRMPLNSLLALVFVVGAGTLVVMPLCSKPLATALVVVVAGAAWAVGLSSMYGALQLYLPAWVRARGLALLSVVAFGSQSLGSVVVGRVASTTSLSGASWAAGAALLVGVGLRWWAPVRQLDHVDRTPTQHWSDPALVVDAAEIRGQVVVTVEYWIDRRDVSEFLRRLEEVRRVRLRTGATRWRLLKDAETPRRFVEEYTVASWEEHKRQHHQRLVASDEDCEARAYAMSNPPPRAVHLFQKDLGS